MNHLKLILTHHPLFVSGSPCSLGAYYWSCNSRHMVLWDQNSQTGRDKGRGHRGGEDKSEFLSHQTQWAKKRKEWEIKMQIESCVRDSKHRLGREHKIKGNNLPWGRRQSYAAYAPKHMHENECMKSRNEEKQPAKLLTTEVRKSQEKPSAADTIY